MTPGIKIVIENTLWHGARAKRYRSTPEQIRRNELEKRIQRERNERARKQAITTSADSERKPTPEK